MSNKKIQDPILFWFLIFYVLTLDVLWFWAMYQIIKHLFIDD